MNKNKRPSWCKYVLGMNVKMRFKERFDKRFDTWIMKKSKEGKRITVKHRPKVVCIFS